MNIASAILIVRDFLRSGGSTTAYPDSQITNAIQIVCDDFVRRTKCTKTKSQVSLIVADAGALPTMPTGFTPERLLSAYLSGSNVVVGGRASGSWGSPYYGEGQRDYSGSSPNTVELEVVSYQEVLNRRYEFATTAQPQVIGFNGGFTGTATGGVFPTPDQTYTCNLVWWQSFSTGDSTLIIPDDLLKNVLARGVAPFVQKSEVENNGWTGRALQDYERWVMGIASAYSDGTKEIFAPVGWR